MLIYSQGRELFLLIFNTEVVQNLHLDISLAVSRFFCVYTSGGTRKNLTNQKNMRTVPILSVMLLMSVTISARDLTGFEQLIDKRTT